MREYRPTPNLDINIQLDNGRLPLEIREWLAANIEPIISESAPGILAEGNSWTAWIKVLGWFGKSAIVTFRFATPDQAMLFKLVWGGK